jgi:hypothetical protein
MLLALNPECTLAQSASGNGTLTVDDAWDTYRLLQRDKRASSGSFLTAIKGSKLFFPARPPPAVNEELVKRREYLRARAELSEYRDLTKSVRPGSSRDEVGKILPKLGIGLNMVRLMSVSC